MNLDQVVTGSKVKFSPNQDWMEEDYSLDGVSIGDTGVVVGVDCGDVLVNFTRQDGSVCEGFYAFPEDLEIIK